VAVSESFPSALDIEVLRVAVEDDRILITEDKDFGEWIFAHRERMKGVLFIRFPGNARSKLSETVLLLIEKHGTDLVGHFTVLEPGRARIRQYP
jgi:predicted nuclease of predicted toxin-antitoxin system